MAVGEFTRRDVRAHVRPHQGRRSRTRSLVGRNLKLAWMLLFMRATPVPIQFPNKIHSYTVMDMAQPAARWGPTLAVKLMRGSTCTQDGRTSYGRPAVVGERV